MKTKLALSLFVAVLLSACSSTKTTTTSTTMSTDPKAGRYAEAAPPAEGPEADIPTEGPADVNVNPAYMPSPLLRNSAVGGP
jgi:ABC-type enterochelin transport system substrate-binding protein